MIYDADLKRHWNRSIEFETFEGFFFKKEENKNEKEKKGKKKKRKHKQT